MSYIALYRKFRPRTFEDVKGQDHIVTTIRNQITANRLGHAYLFCGTRGTGKTSVAKIFASAVNCQNPHDGSPCGECANCKAISAGASMSVIEIDAASNNGVDNVRQIKEEVSFSPADGCAYKVYIIDEVHMLSTGAFNALLKTLEEPPSYCIFILATTDPQKLPVTILSRCQRYDFKRITVDTMTDRLEEITALEGLDVEPRALRYIARSADGAFRDALSMLDQCIAFHYGEKLTYDMVQKVLGTVDGDILAVLLKAIKDAKVSECMKVVEDIIMQGREINQFVNDFIWYLRNILLAKTTTDTEDTLDMSIENAKQVIVLASEMELEVIIRYIRVFSELSNSLRYATSKRVLLEVALVKLCRPEMENDYESLISRIAALEKRIEEGGLATKVIERVVEREKKTDTNVTPSKPLPKALPEDIQKIVNKWHEIIKRANPGLKMALMNSHPTLNDVNELKIVTRDKVAALGLNNESNRLEFSNIINEYTGKAVSFHMEKIPEDGSADKDNPNILKLANVNAEIEIDYNEEDDTHV